MQGVAIPEEPGELWGVCKGFVQPPCQLLAFERIRIAGVDSESLLKNTA